MLQQAVLWLRKTMGQARIGKGRMAVKRKLEALRDDDASLPAEQRKYRTLTQEHFRQLCTEAGGVSRPELLLDYLHAAGIVFYHRGVVRRPHRARSGLGPGGGVCRLPPREMLSPIAPAAGPLQSHASRSPGVARLQRRGTGALPQPDDVLRHLLRPSAGRSRGQGGDGIHRPRPAAEPRRCGG